MYEITLLNPKKPELCYVLVKNEKELNRLLKHLDTDFTVESVYKISKKYLTLKEVTKKKKPNMEFGI